MDLSARARIWFAWVSRQEVISRVTANLVSTLLRNETSLPHVDTYQATQRLCQTCTP
jgi:hypothetical protein